MKKLCLIFAIVGLIFSCGPERIGPAANDKSVADLKQLFIQHPELGQANLKQIKDAAANTDNNGGSKSGNKIFAYTVEDEAQMEDINFEEEAPPVLSIFEPKASDSEKAAEEVKPALSLDPKIAKTAQELINDILDNFDFTAWFRAKLRIVAIQINEMREAQKFIEAYKDKFHKGKSSLNKFGDDENVLGKVTCEEIVNNPWQKFTENKFDLLVNVNKPLIKQMLSGCAEILGQTFVQCVSDFNKIISIVDEHATCSIKSFGELNEATSGRFYEVSVSLDNCLKNVFPKCGYNMKYKASQL